MYAAAQRFRSASEEIRVHHSARKKGRGMSFLKRVKAALGIGAIWGALAGAVGAVAGGVAGLLTGGAVTLFLLGGGVAGVAGFALGSAFGGVLSLAERNRTLGELSVGRAGFWGAVVGAALPLAGAALMLTFGDPVLGMRTLLTAAVAGASSYGVLTATLAAGTVALAKRASPELHGGDELTDDRLLS